MILQEIAATRDSPDEIAYDLLQDAAFPQPVDRPGDSRHSRERHAASPPAICSTFLRSRYQPENMVLSAAGGVATPTSLRHAEALFGGLNGGGRHGGERAGAVRRWDARLGEAVRAEPPSDGFPGPSYREEDFFTAQVFSGLFGGGMSSRLFQEVREKRGLCYAIYSSAGRSRMQGCSASTRRRVAI